MEIHKPKPWHGVREFLKEYVIIVVGVLTALGAETMVQDLHERRLSAEARDAVRAELDLDLANARQILEPQEPCLKARLAEVGGVLERAANHEPFQVLNFIGGPLPPALYRQRWEAATAGGRTSLLSLDEQRDFARVYAQIEYLQTAAREETEAWTRLAALEGRARLSDEQLARAFEALGAARVAANNVRFSTALAFNMAARINITGKAKPIAYRRIQPVCLKSSMTRQQAEEMTGTTTFGRWF
jgi:hypothetical protein